MNRPAPDSPKMNRRPGRRRSTDTSFLIVLGCCRVMHTAVALPSAGVDHARLVARHALPIQLGIHLSSILPVSSSVPDHSCGRS